MDILKNADLLFNSHDAKRYMVSIEGSIDICRY